MTCALGFHLPSPGRLFFSCSARWNYVCRDGKGRRAKLGEMKISKSFLLKVENKSLTEDLKGKVSSILMGKLFALLRNAMRGESFSIKLILFGLNVHLWLTRKVGSARLVNIRLGNTESIINESVRVSRISRHWSSRIDSNDAEYRADVSIHSKINMRAWSRI